MNSFTSPAGLTQVDWEMGSKWSYNNCCFFFGCCFQDLFKAALRIFVHNYSVVMTRLLLSSVPVLVD